MYDDLQLLDCTLRDGGYINQWTWGFQSAQEIIRLLVKAGVDVVEVGFLKNVEEYRPERNVCSNIEQLNRLLPKHSGKTVFSAMAMCSDYDLSRLSPYEKRDGEPSIDLIRVTAHEYDIEQGMEFARAIQDKGYRISINPINIMGYSDKQLLWILEQVNEIHPAQFSIVDTFGSMKRRDLDRIVSIADHNLHRDIRLGLHLHENMSLSCCLAQAFVDKHLNRPIAVDASLMGLGRVPGNLPIELIADYLNDYAGKQYQLDDMMDAIQDYIVPLKNKAEWGYTPAYFLSARHNLHRNYAEHYLTKGDLTNRDINYILSQFDTGKKAAFDAQYADALYEQYRNKQIDDAAARNALKQELEGKKILVLAPGSSIVKHKETIRAYLSQERPLVIAVNFIPDEYQADYVFFGNNKRFEQAMGSKKAACKIVTTSNVAAKQVDYQLNYNSLSGMQPQGCNSLMMLMQLLGEIQVQQLVLAGADGYADKGSADDYCTNALRSYTQRGAVFNEMVAKAIYNMKLPVCFLTPSAYQLYDAKEESDANRLEAAGH